MSEIVFILISLFIGGCAGVAVTYFATKKTDSASNNAKQSQEVLLARLRAQLSDTQASLANLEAHAEELRSQITEIDYILTSHEDGEEQAKITFFGEHASPYIRMQQKEQRASGNAEQQPKDFSNSASGLFAGSQKSED